MAPGSCWSCWSSKKPTFLLRHEFDPADFFGFPGVHPLFPTRCPMIFFRVHLMGRIYDMNSQDACGVSIRMLWNKSPHRWIQMVLCFFSATPQKRYHDHEKSVVSVVLVCSIVPCLMSLMGSVNTPQMKLGPPRCSQDGSTTGAVPSQGLLTAPKQGTSVHCGSAQILGSAPLAAERDKLIDVKNCRKNSVKTRLFQRSPA